MAALHEVAQFPLPAAATLQWANALLAVTVEQLLGYDCDEQAEKIHRAAVQARQGLLHANSAHACTSCLHSHVQP